MYSIQPNIEHIAQLQDQPAEGLIDVVAPSVLVQKPEHDDLSRWKRRVFLKIGGMTSAIALAAGVVAGCDVRAKDSPQDTNRAQTSERADVSEQRGFSEDVVDDIKAAITVDTCKTKVSNEDVLNIYGRVFGETRLPVGSQLLSKRMDATISELDSVQGDVRIEPLPSEFETLRVDALEETGDLPYSQYKSMFIDYLAKFELEYIDGLDEKGTIDDRSRELIATHATWLSPDELYSSKSARKTIVNAMTSLSTIPTEIIKKSGLRQVGIADISSLELNAQAYYADKIILLDASSDDSGLITGEAGIEATTLAHEITHFFHDSICAAATSSYVDDPGYAELNQDFQYGKKEQSLLEKGDLVDGKYTTFRSGVQGKAVVAQPYGASDVIEDVAQVLGEEIIYGGMTGSFFAQEADSTIIYEKTAFMLARLAEKNPAATELYITRLQVARLIDEAETQMKPIVDEQEEIATELYNKGIEPETDARFKALDTELKPYRQIIDRGWAKLPTTI